MVRGQEQLRAGAGLEAERAGTGRPADGRRSKAMAPRQAPKRNRQEGLEPETTPRRSRRGTEAQHASEAPKHHLHGGTMAQQAGGDGQADGRRSKAMAPQQAPGADAEQTGNKQGTNRKASSRKAGNRHSPRDGPKH